MENSSWGQSQYTPLQQHSVSKAFNLLWLIKLLNEFYNIMNFYLEVLTKSHSFTVSSLSIDWVLKANISSI